MIPKSQRKRAASTGPPRPRSAHLALYLFLSLAIAAQLQAGEKLFLPEAPGMTVTSIEGSAVPAMDERAIIEALYAMVEDLVLGSGHSFSLRLSQFETHYPGDFERLQWNEIHGIIKGRAFDIVPISMTVDDAGFIQTAVHLRVDWKEATEDLGMRDRSRGLSVRDALQRFSKRVRETEADAGKSIGSEELTFYRGADPASIKALTTFKVELETLGERSLYRAMVLWEQGADGAVYALMQDPVIVNIEQLVVEEKTPVPYSNPTEIKAALSSTGFLDSPTDKLYVPPSEPRYCQYEFWSEAKTSGLLTNTARHISGDHRADFKGAFTYTCDEECLATCDSFPQTYVCQDTGYTYLGHKSAVALDFQSVSDTDGSASCVTAIACGIFECDPLCPGLSVSINILGNGVAVSNTSGTLWKYVRSIQGGISCEETENPCD